MTATTTGKTVMAFGAIAAGAMASISTDASAALNLSDPSIINLYRLDEQTSGQLNNSVAEQFRDTATPTPPSVPQHHNDFNDGASNGPAWGTGAEFMSGATTVGDGIGLQFTRSDNDHTRLQTLLNTPEGVYSNGKSYSLMLRVKPASLADNNTYILTGNSSNYLAIEGVSSGSGDGGRLRARVREGAGGGETDWQFNTPGGPTDTTKLFPGNWYNVFLSYNANTSITLAIDDGTSFNSLTTTAVPASFDTLANGFADVGVSFALGSHTVGNTPPTAPVSPFDGNIESMVMWDKALTVQEMQAIGLTNIPEPASAGAVVAGMVLVATRRQRRTA